MGIKADRLAVLGKFNENCAYCGLKLSIETLHIDHVIPKKRSKWKSEINRENDNIENYFPSCKSCNSSKGSCTIDEFRNRLHERHQYMMNNYSEYRSMIKFKRIMVNPQPVIFYFETLA